MPYARPTLPSLITQTQSNVASRLAGTNPWLPFSTLQILSYVFAGNQYSLYSYLDWIAKQAIPVTSTDEALMAWAALKGLTLTPASAALGQVQFSGVPSTFIPDGTVIVRSDGTLYAIQAGAGGGIDNTGIFTTMVEATTPGLSSNLTLGSTLSNFSLRTPISGVNNTVLQVTAFVGGADVETQDSLRARMIELFSNPVQGGDLQDYATWSLALPGVTRAWTAGPDLMGDGTVSVFFMRDDAQAPFFGIPQGLNGGSSFETRIQTAQGDQRTLADYLYPLRSATALVWAMAPVPVPLDLQIAEVPTDAAIRQGITDALTAFLRREATPGGVFLPDLSSPGTVLISNLETALAAVPGLDFFDIVFPEADVLVNTGEISIPGTITFL